MKNLCFRLISKVVFKLFNILRELALDAAARQQKLDTFAAELSCIVKDISHQYTGVVLTQKLLQKSVRYLHAFQISFAAEIIEKFENPVIVDVGDSAGTHIHYIKQLYNDRHIRALSVNLDETAVKRIREAGFEAICCRAEVLAQAGIRADIFLCFETLEHLSDPIRFLYSISRNKDVKYLVITVPYVRKSRIGLHHIREKIRKQVTAEDTHIFELCPDDWNLVAAHSGWNVIKKKVYLQYPRWHPLYITMFLWRRFDFEGFYGMVLTPDSEWSSLYRDW